MPVKINTVSAIKKELQHLSKEELVEHCIRMAKYKKENKELLNYMLYESDDERDYIKTIKSDISLEFDEINRDSMFYVKKSVRRIHRMVMRHIKYSTLKETEVELLLYFCVQMAQSGIPFADSKVMVNFFSRQYKNVHKTLSKLHEDFRFDYQEELAVVEEYATELGL